MGSFALDERLAADTQPVGELPLSQVLLMDDARFPWLILVPRIAGARELIDLDETDRRTLLTEVCEVGRALEALRHPDKLNIATLGNIVAQLHVHVVARHAGDAAWPGPVWGCAGQRTPYAAADRNALVAQLRTALGALLA